MDSIFTSLKIEKYGVCGIDNLLPYFNNSSTRRLDIDVKSVIACLFPYTPNISSNNRNIALYAVYPDYHIIVGDKLQSACLHLSQLHPEYRFKGYVDISPIDEVKAAYLCGLGNVGRNGLLVNKEYGAFHFIGCILTDMPLPNIKREGEEGCDNCGNCLKNCPTSALESNCIDLCLSQITQKKGVLNDWETAEIKKGGLVWGCDNCSLACGSFPQNFNFSTDIENCLTTENIDKLMKNRAFNFRGKAVLLRNLNILKGEKDETNE